MLSSDWLTQTILISYWLIVFKKQDKCLIHFIAMPDSSDNWGTCYPENEPGDSPDDKDDIYHVSLDWVLEMEKYNEWMNEEDYEVDEDGEAKDNKMNMTYDDLEASEEKPDKKKKSGSKRKRSPSPAGKRKSKGGGKSKKSRNEDDDDEDLTADMSDPPPENNISEVKQNPLNMGKSDMQPGKEN